MNTVAIIAALVVYVALVIGFLSILSFGRKMEDAELRDLHEMRAQNPAEP